MKLKLFKNKKTGQVTAAFSMKELKKMGFKDAKFIEVKRMRFLEK